MVDASSSPAPWPVGSRHRVTVLDVAFGGDGVARLDGFVIFVPFVAIGEEVEVELTEVKKSYARARLLAVLRPAAVRTTPACPYFGECGGCQYQHLDYAEQLRLKQHQITELLQRIGGVPAEVVQPIIGCPSTYGYRNRLMLRSQWNKTEQRLRVGFLRAESRLVVDVDDCAIAEPVLRAQIAGVRANPPPRGGLKVVLRCLPDDWEVPRDSFFQNNYHLLPALVDCVRDRLADSGAQWLIDAYCGVGFFAIELAGCVRGFVGVECDGPAIHAARRNAERRGLTTGEFVVGQSELLLPDLLRRYPAAETAVILDPPRVGCRPEAIAGLRALAPRQVLYVSCHPATLARDLNAFCADGVYEVVRVTPLDMFPQTQHVECVVDLRRRAGVPADNLLANPE